jgi:hypothetical protein
MRRKIKRCSRLMVAWVCFMDECIYYSKVRVDNELMPAYLTAHLLQLFLSCTPPIPHALGIRAIGAVPKPMHAPPHVSFVPFPAVPHSWHSIFQPTPSNPVVSHIVAADWLGINPSLSAQFPGINITYHISDFIR